METYEGNNFLFLRNRIEKEKILRNIKCSFKLNSKVQTVKRKDQYEGTCSR